MIIQYSSQIRWLDYSYLDFFVQDVILLHYPLSIILLPYFQDVIHLLANSSPPPPNNFWFEDTHSQRNCTQLKVKILLISILIILATMHGFGNLKLGFLPKYLRLLEPAERQLDFLLARALHPQVPLGRGINARCFVATICTRSKFRAGKG